MAKVRGWLVLACLLPLAGCTSTEEYLEVARAQQKAYREVIGILAKIHDEKDMAAARDELDDRFAQCERIARKARALPKLEPPEASSPLGQAALALQEAVREFDCRRCGKRVCVCRPCDRGQEYCGENCAELSRQAYLRVARARYQRTRRGAHLHADRQRRYRARGGLRRRTKKMVTDHGSVVARSVGTVVAGCAVRLRIFPAELP